jgi:predicted ATP-grasp superfamily ATP-dependent carboligase
LSHPRRAEAGPAAVVFVLTATGLAVARSLAPRGVAVYGVDENRHNIGHFSRWVRRDPRIATLAPGPALLDALLAFGAEQERPPVLFLAGDPYIDFVCQNRDALAERFVLSDSMRPELGSLMLDKRAFYARCRALGILIPATWFPSDAAEAADAAAQVRYPAILKPTHPHLLAGRLGMDKLVECADAAQLLEWWRRFRDWGLDSVVQEVIAGPESNIFVGALYVDRDGVCRSLFTARKTRQYPPWYGTAAYMEACWNEEIARESLAFVERFGYRGMCGTEYKWDDRDRAWKLIEVSPRADVWFALTRRAGIDVTWDAYCDLAGRPNPPHVGGQDDRARWQFFVKDAISAWYFWRRGEIGWREYLRSFADPRHKEEAMLSWRDPGTLLGYPIAALRRLRQGEGR